VVANVQSSIFPYVAFEKLPCEEKENYYQRSCDKIAEEIQTKTHRY
jgi:hypothetical protein